MCVCVFSVGCAVSSQLLCGRPEACLRLVAQCLFVLLLFAPAANLVDVQVRAPVRACRCLCVGVSVLGRDPRRSRNFPLTRRPNRAHHPDVIYPSRHTPESGYRPPTVKRPSYPCRRFDGRPSKVTIDSVQREFCVRAYVRACPWINRWLTNN